MTYERKTRTCKKCGKRKPHSEYRVWPNSGPRPYGRTCWTCQEASKKACQRRSETPAKTQAKKAVRRAVMRGELKVPAVCEVCATGRCSYNRGLGRLSAHHVDYAKPLDVIWLCGSHHKAWHKLFIAENAK